MLIIISPAKTFDYNSTVKTQKYTQPKFLDDASQLVKELRPMKATDLSKMMKISEKLGQLNFERYHSFTKPFTKDNARQAIFAFMGDVYMGLDIHSFNATEITYTQNHLLILSGLYGLLRPLDLMQPYRLEMGSKFANSRGKNLYEFWGSKITEQINKYAKKQKEKILVNLASNEYFKSIKKNELDLELLTPIFKERKFDEYITLGIHAKRARGLMSKYILKKKVNTKAALKKFNLNGYKFNKDLTDEKKGELVFTRE